MSRAGIAVAGNWIIDHVKLIDALPAEEHLAVIHGESIGTGGAPYNVGIGLRMLDPAMPLWAIGVVGEDADGRYILDHLSRLGIDTARMRMTAGLPTSYTDVMTVRSTGRRTFFHNVGANGALGPGDFDFTGLGARILHLGYLTLLPGLDAQDDGDASRTRAAAVLAAASAEGITTTVDVVTSLGPTMCDVVGPALPHTDYLIVNELEAAALVSMEIRDKASGALLRENLTGVAERLLDAGVRRGVVIHAPEGAYWKSLGAAGCFVPSLRVPQEDIRGTAGAGDAFCAGVLHGIHESWTPERCLQLGAANAAKSLSHETTTGGLGPMSEVLSLIEKYGYRDS